MPEFIITERCLDCGHKWKVKVFSATDDASDIPDPECPKCSAKVTPIGMDVAAGKAPGIGGSPMVKAMDMTANTVMREYGLTDLKSDGRQGATMAPSLPPPQQAAADGMFDPRARAKSMTRESRAMMGALNGIARSGVSPTDPNAPKAIEMIHSQKQTVPINIIAK